MTKEAGLKILSMFVILLMTFSVDSEVRTGLERYFPTHNHVKGVCRPAPFWMMVVVKGPSRHVTTFV